MVGADAGCISSVLAYAFSEWILMALMLLQCAVSFLCNKFASTFGLKPPCYLCQKVNRLYETCHQRSSSLGGILCHVHAMELSALGQDRQQRIRHAQGSEINGDRLVPVSMLDDMTMADSMGHVMPVLEGAGALQPAAVTVNLDVECRDLIALQSQFTKEGSIEMIHRLQNEKAVLQMEALRYQQMMEEQSEYDQAVVRLLNELLWKREQEKRALLKELEICKQRALLFEAWLVGAANSDASSAEDDKQNDRICSPISLFGSTPYNSDRERDGVNWMALDGGGDSILEELRILKERLFTAEGENEELSSDSHADNNDSFLDDDQIATLQDTVEEAHAGEVIEQKQHKLVELEEADEFLWHCIKSLKRGDEEGMALLRTMLCRLHLLIGDAKTEEEVSVAGHAMKQRL